MGLNLQQDEIDALLALNNQGLEIDENASPAAETMPQNGETNPSVAHMREAGSESVNLASSALTLEEMEAASQAAKKIVDDAEVERIMESLDRKDAFLTFDEIDVLGEIGNICMGSSATVLYTLLDKLVSITTPRVHVFESENVLRYYETPFVVVQVEYTEGVDGKNLLLLKEYDAAVITDILMGGEGIIERDVELTDLHLSAISEIMNQMIGASATALSKIVGTAVNISPPESTWVGANTNVGTMLDPSDMIVQISFDIEIEGVLNSQLMQLMSYPFAKKLAAQLHASNKAASDAQVPVETKAPVPAPSAAPAAPSEAPAETPVPAAAPAAPPMPEPSRMVQVSPMQYHSFDEQPKAPVYTPVNDGIGLIQDIPLQVTVELGKAKKNIQQILDFGVGTVVVLDKMAGEQIEVLVNGKTIARGEVVVIDENYGVRITEIVGVKA